MNKRQIWEMTRARGQARMPIPIPHLRVNGNIRFRHSSLEQWVRDLETYQLTGALPKRSVN